MTLKQFIEKFTFCALTDKKILLFDFDTKERITAFIYSSEDKIREFLQQPMLYGALNCKVYDFLIMTDGIFIYIKYEQ